MLRRTAAAACLAFGLLGAPPALGRDFATTALNILPSGQSQTPGPGADRQAQMYNGLTPLFDRVTDADLRTLLQVRAPGPGDDRPRGDDPGQARRHHQARQLQRPARLRQDRRRRHLRGGLRDRREPDAAARPGALHRPARRDRRAEPVRHHADPQPRPVRAQQADQPDRRQAEQRHPSRRPEGRAPPARHRHLPRGHKHLVQGKPAGHRALHAQRHLRVERDQGPVPRPGRRRRGPQQRVPRRPAQALRRPAGRQRVRGPARAQRSRHDDDAQEERPLRGAAALGTGRRGAAQRLL